MIIAQDFKKVSISKLRTLTNAELAAHDTYYCIDSGKEGLWRYDPSDTTSVDNLGTVLVTTTNKRLKRIINDGYVYPEWFGAVGDGITNDYQSIQNALDLNLVKTLKFQPKIYKLNSTININIEKNSLDLNGGTLDFTNLPNGTNTNYNIAINIISNITISNNSPLLTDKFIKNGKIFGKIAANNYTNGLILGDNYTPFVSFSNLYFYGFDRIVTYRNNSWCNGFYNCQFWSPNGTCIYSPNGITNSGERNNFVNCQIFNSKIGILATNSSTNMFVNCSFDYNEQDVAINNAAIVRLSCCHIESNFFTWYWFNADTPNGKIVIENSDIVITNTSDNLPNGDKEIFYSINQTPYGGIYLNNVTFHFSGITQYQNDKFHAGTGIINVDKCRVLNPYYGDNQNKVVFSNSTNLIHNNTFDIADLSEFTLSQTGGGSIPYIDSEALIFASQTGKSSKLEFEFDVNKQEEIRIQLHYQAVFLSISNPVKLNLKFLNSKKQLISTQSKSLSTNTTSNIIKYTWITDFNIPLGTRYCVFEIDTELTTGSDTRFFSLKDLHIEI